MPDKKSHCTPDAEFEQDNRPASNETSDLDEITLSDQAIEQAMRVYSPEEAIALLTCGAPGHSASTETWRDFLERMRKAPLTRSTQLAIQEAERELMRRTPAGRG
jgi:hypothetical protein